MSWNILIPSSLDGWWIYKVRKARRKGISNHFQISYLMPNYENSCIPELLSFYRAETSLVGSQEETTYESDFVKRCRCCLSARGKRRIFFVQLSFPEYHRLLCLSQASDKSHESDFDFMKANGYACLLGETGGRMRCITFWKKDKLDIAFPELACSKDRTISTFATSS